ncbi:unnamed protein product [Anisakis simplex]|uniref:G-protein coupled receptors family 1 profile domain-containing protein n=1 Tax=Anisakis simplex TaxID=6269 RepID=A0A0M3KDY8_ANISI|nr:unnamed protein product [Anisakis simplex]
MCERALIACERIIVGERARVRSPLKVKKVLLKQKQKAEDRPKLGLLPLFLIVVPLVCVYALTLTPFQAGAWASLAPVSFNWEPCAHPFITIYFVSPFRRRFRQCFRLDACRPRHITGRNEAAAAAATHHQQPRHTVHIQLPTAAAGNSHYPTIAYQEHRQLPGHYPIEPLTTAPPIKRQISCTQFVNVAPSGLKTRSVDASASNAIQPSLRNAALTNTTMWC